VAIVDASDVDEGLRALRATPGGEGATVIGEVRADPPGLVLARTAFGGTRIVDTLVGDPLPRIC
jgi:hydrogenase expression/formation protein HypE